VRFEETDFEFKESLMTTMLQWDDLISKVEQGQIDTVLACLVE